MDDTKLKNARIFYTHICQQLKQEYIKQNF